MASTCSNIGVARIDANGRTPRREGPQERKARGMIGD